MFDKKKQVTPQPKPKPKPVVKKVNHTPSIISEDVRLTGTLISQGEVQLDGRIDGDLYAKHLVVGTTGLVDGKVDAKSVIVKGKINGSLSASEVNIQSTAQVHGDVFHDTLSVDAGAVIEGNLKQRIDSEELDTSYEDSNEISNEDSHEDSNEDSNFDSLDDDNDLAFVNQQKVD